MTQLANSHLKFSTSKSHESPDSPYICLSQPSFYCLLLSHRTSPFSCLHSHTRLMHDAKSSRLQRKYRDRSSLPGAPSFLVPLRVRPKSSRLLQKGFSCLSAAHMRSRLSSTRILRVHCITPYENSITSLLCLLSLHNKMM